MSLQRGLFGVVVLVAATAACASFVAGPTHDVDGGPDGDAVAADAGGADATEEASVDAGLAPADAAAEAGLLRAFVTATGYTGVTTAGIADNKCAAEAAGRISGKFVAWYPDVTGDKSAPARLVRSDGGVVDGPWYTVDGKRIAASRAALTNTTNVALESPITRSAANTVIGGSVWTGTYADGGIGTVCPLGVNPTSGNVGQTGPAWTQQTSFTATCTSSIGLYCFQVE